jgi:hypothetical protein
MQGPKVGDTAEMFIGTQINWMISLDLQGAMLCMNHSVFGSQLSVIVDCCQAQHLPHYSASWPTG